MIFHDHGGLEPCYALHMQLLCSCYGCPVLVSPELLELHMNGSPQFVQFVTQFARYVCVRLYVLNE